MTTLKLSIATGTTNNTAPLWNFNLGTAPTAGATNNDAAYATAPLGNNSALGTIEFSLNVSDLNVIKSYNAQLASIFNMFAKYGASQSVTNLEPWAVSQTSGSNTGVIQEDITADNVNDNWSAPSDGQTKSHNGVAWSKTATESSVTITGTANIYRSKFTSGGTTTQYQTYFHF